MRKKDRYPVGNQGADGDFRFDQIESMTSSAFNQRKNREYHGVYEKTNELLDSGRPPEEIRKSLGRSPHLLEFSSDDSPRRIDEKKAHNAVELALERLRSVATEDAIANRPPNVPTFRP